MINAAKTAPKGLAPNMIPTKNSLIPFPSAKEGKKGTIIDKANKKMK